MAMMRATSPTRTTQSKQSIRTTVPHAAMASAKKNRSATRAGARFVAPAVTVDAFPMFVDHYKIPYLVHRPGEGSRIAGELFEVDDESLSVLDELEGYPVRYDRLKIDVAVEGSDMQAWLYALPGDTRGLAFGTRRLLSDYSRAVHADYVPRERRDPALRRAWGGYEP